MGHPSMPRWRYTVFRPCPFVLLRTTNIVNKNYNANNLPKKTEVSPEKGKTRKENPSGPLFCICRHAILQACSTRAGFRAGNARSSHRSRRPP